MTRKIKLSSLLHILGKTPKEVMVLAKKLCVQCINKSRTAVTMTSKANKLNTIIV